MKTTQKTANRFNDNDLQQIIEPLASYLCAAEQPQAALNAALVSLFREMEQINRCADAEVACLVATRGVLPV